MSLCVFDHGPLISHDWQLQAGHGKLVCGKRRFYIRTLPDIAGIFAAHVGKGRQDAAGETIQAAVHADLAFERCAEILEQEILAHRGRDMFPREDFIRAALAVGVKERVESMLFKGVHPGIVSAAFIPGIELGAVLPGADKRPPPFDGRRARAMLRARYLRLWSS